MQMFVFYPEDLKVGVKTIKTYAERMRNEGVSRAIMVTIANITPFARQCLQEMAQKYYIESVRAPNAWTCKLPLSWNFLSCLGPQQNTFYLHCFVNLLHCSQQDS